MRRALAIIAAVLAAGIFVPVADAGSGAERSGTTARVKVGDDFFAPVNLKIKKNDRVKFHWLDSNTDSHNVTLQKGPNGVKKGCPKHGPDAYSPLISKCNKSSTGAVGIKFKKKFDVKGTYDFVCTIHPTTMKLTIKVGK